MGKIKLLVVFLIIFFSFLLCFGAEAKLSASDKALKSKLESLYKKFVRVVKSKDYNKLKAISATPIPEEQWKSLTSDKKMFAMMVSSMKLDFSKAKFIKMNRGGDKVGLIYDTSYESKKEFVLDILVFKKDGQTYKFFERNSMARLRESFKNDKTKAFKKMLKDKYFKLSPTRVSTGRANETIKLKAKDEGPFKYYQINAIAGKGAKGVVFLNGEIMYEFDEEGGSMSNNMAQQAIKSGENVIRLQVDSVSPDFETSLLSDSLISIKLNALNRRDFAKKEDAMIVINWTPKRAKGIVIDYKFNMKK